MHMTVDNWGIRPYDMQQGNFSVSLFWLLAAPRWVPDEGGI
jgi:hypothetical protein